MLRYLYALLVGLVGAIIVHLTIIVLLPSLSNKSAWALIAANTENAAPELLSAIAAVDQRSDPLMDSVVCRYDLAGGLYRIRSQGDPAFWSVSVHSSMHRIDFSANDRIAPNSSLDLVLVNAAQLRDIRQNPSEALQDSIIVPLAENEGFVAVRIFRPNDTWAPVTDDFLATLECGPNGS